MPLLDADQELRGNCSIWDFGCLQIHYSMGVYRYSILWFGSLPSIGFSCLECVHAFYTFLSFTCPFL